MKKLIVIFQKTVLVALVAALALAALPLTSVSASGVADPTDPPADGPRQISDERIEQIWVRMQQVYERQGQFLDLADGMIEKFQRLLGRMDENGRDVSELQTALGAFEDCLKEAHPIYEGTKGIINSHQGFDANGKVINREMAIETVKDLGAKIREVRSLIGEPGEALREAFKAFRDANRPADTF